MLRRCYADVRPLHLTPFPFHLTPFPFHLSPFTFQFSPFSFQLSVFSLRPYTLHPPFSCPALEIPSQDSPRFPLSCPAIAVVRRVSYASAVCHAIAGGPAIFKGSARLYTLHFTLYTKKIALKAIFICISPKIIVSLHP